MRIQALCLLALAPLLARADTVYMKDTDLTIEGKVHLETDEFIVLLIHEDQGKIRIAKNKIKKIEYDIKTQLANLGAEDYAARYKVALWALEKGMTADAINLLEEIKGKPGVEIDTAKRLGHAYEQRKQLDKALEAYNEYLKSKPDDAQVIERVNALAKEVNPEATGQGTPAPPKVADGLEADGLWIGENWGIACRTQQTVEPGSNNKMIACQSNGGTQDKVAFSRANPNGVPLNLSQSKEMVFRVFHNGPTRVSLAVAFTSGAGEFFESKQHSVQPNQWTDIAFRLDAKDFKAKKSDWKHTLELESKDNISRMAFMVYQQQRPFTMYVDGIFFK